MYRSKNPYKTRIEKDETGKEHYYVSFKDGQSVAHDIEISYELFQAFKSFEKEYKRESNIFDRHMLHNELSENQIDKFAVHSSQSIEDIVIDRVMCEKLLSELSEIQRRRFILYYFYGFSYEGIAKLEGLSKMAVKYSIENAVKKLRKNKKFN